MSADEDLQPLEEVMDRMATAAESDRVCVGDLLEAMGHRSHGALMLAPSLVVISPISGIPGVPTLLGIIIALISVQMLIGRKTIWLPRRLRHRCIAGRRLQSAIAHLQPVGRTVDRWVRPRLLPLTRKPFRKLIAVTCLALALIMPPMELLPFATSILAAAVAAFSLALFARDGLLAVLGYATAAGGVGFGLSAVL